MLNILILCSSQSQSPPSPKKLPSTKSETTISPKNEFTDADIEISTQTKCIKNAGAVCEHKSNASIQFELGPPNESFTGNLEVCVLFYLKLQLKQCKLYFPGMLLLIGLL